MLIVSLQRHRFWRFVPLSLLFGAAAVFMLSGGRRYLTFAALAENHAELCDWIQRGGALAIAGFTLGYAGLTALSVPAAMLMTLTSGFLFGPWLGALYALIGATLGATIVMLAARAGLADLTELAGTRVQRLKAGFREDAFSYLLCLRLVPIFPFWLVNLVAGAAGIGTWVYVAATFIGMIPGALVYASLGSGLGTVMEHPHFHIWSEPRVLLPLIGLAVLALLPVVYKHWRARRRRQPAE